MPFIMLLIIGVKVISTILLYVIGAIAVISLIAFAVLYIGKLSGKSEAEWSHLFYINNGQSDYTTTISFEI